MRKSLNWLRYRRGLSPIFATMILATIIIVFGTVAYYYANNVTTATTNNYVKSSSVSQQSIAERISFENLIYNPGASSISIYVLNSGLANNLQINTFLLYNQSANDAIVGNPMALSSLTDLNTGKAITSLNIEEEGFFTVTNVPNLGNSAYTVTLLTVSGSAFSYEFTP